MIRERFFFTLIKHRQDGSYLFFKPCKNLRDKNDKDNGSLYYGKILSSIDTDCTWYDSPNPLKVYEVEVQEEGKRIAYVYSYLYEAYEIKDSEKEAFPKLFLFERIGNLK